MLAPSRLLAALGARAAAGEEHLRLTGGTCSWFDCDTFRNAKCTNAPDYVCVCEPPLHNLGGECVEPGRCARSTQVSCAVDACPAGQTCVSGSALSSDHYCVCDKGCAMNDGCVDEDAYFGRKDYCSKLTGGSCLIDECLTYRNATCSGYLPTKDNSRGVCICDPPHSCAVNGECVAPGDCPKHIDVYCGDGKKSACPEGTRCLTSGRPGDGQCVCDDCALNDQCVSKEAYFEAQRAARAAEALLSVPDVSRQRGRGVGAMGLVALSLLSAALAVGVARRRRPERPGDDFVKLADAES